MNADLKVLNVFDDIPPLYLPPLLVLEHIRARQGLDSVPASTVLFVFQGFRFSQKRTREILSELCKMGVLERVGPTLFYLGYKIHLPSDDEEERT